MVALAAPDRAMGGAWLLPGPGLGFGLGLGLGFGDGLGNGRGGGAWPEVVIASFGGLAYHRGPLHLRIGGGRGGPGP